MRTADAAYPVCNLIPLKIKPHITAKVVQPA